MNQSPILVATDFSRCGTLAVHRAARLAASLRAPLRLVHVASLSALETLRAILASARPELPQRLLAEFGARLEEQAARVRAEHGIEATAQLLEGETEDAVLAAADATSARLIVLGATGERPVRDFLIGTTAERLVGKSLRPVLVVRRESLAPYRRALVAVDASPYALPAARAALSTVPESDLELMHTFELPFEGRLRHAGIEDSVLESMLSHAAREAAVLLEQLATRARAEGARHLVTRFEHGPPARLILDRAEKTGADLIVVGKHGRSALEELILGSVTRRLLADAHCDVLVTAARDD